MLWFSCELSPLESCFTELFSSKRDSFTCLELWIVNIKLCSHRYFPTPNISFPPSSLHFRPRFLSPPYFFGPFLPTFPLYQVSCHLRAEKEYLYVHTLRQRLAAGSKSANEYPELFDKIFITGLWDANLTEKKKKKPCNCIMFFFSFFSLILFCARKFTICL